MSVQFDRLEHFPPQFKVQDSLAYVRQSGYFAIHFRQSSQTVATRLAAQAVLTLEEQIAIFRGSPDMYRSIAPQSGTISAVYTLEPGGSIAVPTGQVFLRLVEGIPIETRQDSIQQAGYQISEIVFYAPHAAWLRPLSGEIADALRLLPRLESIDPVEAVEPQMVMGRSKRELEG